MQPQRSDPAPPGMEALKAPMDAVGCILFQDLGSKMESS